MLVREHIHRVLDAVADGVDHPVILLLLLQILKGVGNLIAALIDVLLDQLRAFRPAVLRLGERLRDLHHIFGIEVSQRPEILAFDLLKSMVVGVLVGDFFLSGIIQCLFLTALCVDPEGSEAGLRRLHAVEVFRKICIPAKVARSCGNRCDLLPPGLVKLYLPFPVRLLGDHVRLLRLVGLLPPIIHLRNIVFDRFRRLLSVIISLAHILVETGIDFVPETLPSVGLRRDPLRYLPRLQRAADGQLPIALIVLPQLELTGLVGPGRIHENIPHLDLVPEILPPPVLHPCFVQVLYALDAVLHGHGKEHSGRPLFSAVQVDIGGFKGALVGIDAQLGVEIRHLRQRLCFRIRDCFQPRLLRTAVTWFRIFVSEDRHIDTLPVVVTSGRVNYI